MDFIRQLSALEVHDSVLKSLTLAFEESKVVLEIDIFNGLTDDYITNRLTFHGVSRICMTDVDISSGEIEVYSMKLQDGVQGTYRIIFQFLQGPQKPGVELGFNFKEGRLDR